MAENFIEQAPVQDQDLLQRLSLYFDALDQRLRRGQGWFIFNAANSRSERITAFINARISSAESHVSAFFVPWRDFALSAYVSEVGLPVITAGEDDLAKTPRVRRELDIARTVTQETSDRLLFSDLVVLIGLKPSHWHEAIYLDRTIEERYRRRMATILMTPEMPRSLEAEFATLDPTGTFWRRIFQRMYETSLVAL